MTANRLVFVGLVIAVCVGPTVARAQQPASSGQTAKDRECKEVSYPSLAALTLDKSMGSVAAAGLPQECDLPTRSNQRSVHPAATATHLCQWEAFFCNTMRICHRPLYFEDRELERYGCENCLQPTRSVTRFAAQVLVLPVNKIRLPPRTCVSSPCATR